MTSLFQFKPFSRIISLIVMVLKSYAEKYWRILPILFFCSPATE